MNSRKKFGERSRGGRPRVSRTQLTDTSGTNDNTIVPGHSTSYVSKRAQKNKEPIEVRSTVIFVYQTSTKAYEVIITRENAEKSYLNAWLKNHESQIKDLILDQLH